MDFVEKILNLSPNVLVERMSKDPASTTPWSSLNFSDLIKEKLSTLKISTVLELETALEHRRDDLINLESIGESRLRSIENTVREFREKNSPSEADPRLLTEVPESPKEKGGGSENFWKAISALSMAVATVLAALIANSTLNSSPAPIPSTVKKQSVVKFFKYDWDRGIFEVEIWEPYLKSFKQSSDDGILIAVLNESRSSVKRREHLDFAKVRQFSGVENYRKFQIECPNATSGAELGDKITCRIILVPSSWKVSSETVLEDFAGKQVARSIWDFVAIDSKDSIRLKQIIGRAN